MSQANRSPKRFRFSLRSLLIAMVAFAIGFTARNLAEGLRPFAMSVGVPASTTPVLPGEVLVVEIAKKTFPPTTVTVLSDRTIKLPRVGTIDVADKDLSQIEASLSVAFKAYYPPSPQVQVFRKLPRRP